MRNRNKKVHITNLGCEKNLVDAEAMAGYLDKNLFDIIDDPDLADIVIVNTCGFIKAAKDESIDAILQASELKKKKKIQQVIVAGCMSARYKDELQLELPEVDAFFGTEDYTNIARYLGQTHLENIENIYSMRNLSGPSHFNYMKISEGCDHNCSFCAIPIMRGKHRSRSIDSLVEEAEMLVKNGAKELILIAQDSTYWGKDFYGKPSITKLLKTLEAIEGLKWIRLMYLYPNSIPDDYFAYMKSSKKLLHYVDIPLQHASLKMLKKMRRGGSAEALYALIKKLRSQVNDLIIRTTFIVGHPGETESDFEELLDFVKKVRFNRIGAFTYSEEDNTHSAELRDKVNPEVMTERYNRLMEAQQEISNELNQNLIGKEFEIIIDNYISNAKLLVGRTYGDAPEIDNEVLIENMDSGSDLVGTFQKVRITDAESYELYAELID